LEVVPPERLCSKATLFKDSRAIFYHVSKWLEHKLKAQKTEEFQPPLDTWFGENERLGG
jgi:hypothetical protein